jgi:uncharacterized protein DUF3245
MGSTPGAVEVQHQASQNGPNSATNHSPVFPISNVATPTLSTCNIFAMPKSKPPTDADIIYNRTSLLLARNQRLLSSWLPPPSSEELANQKNTDGLKDDEDELFTPTSEASAHSNIASIVTRLKLLQKRSWSQARSRKGRP